MDVNISNGFIQEDTENDSLFFESNEMMRLRIEKVKEIREMGINPYPYSYDQTHHSKDITDNFEQYGEEDIVKVAGRIMSFRKMGGASFWSIQDFKGKIQVYLRRDTLGEDKYSLIKKIDIGDIVGVEGTVFKTKTDEISIRAQDFCILTKAIGALPEKYHGIVDKELRYRHRSIDMIMNRSVLDAFINRAKAINAIRDFMKLNEFLELEVPVLDTKYGGGEAKPFITQINALGCEAFLRVSPELLLKRLIVGGIERVYTIDKSFRNEGIDKTHYPEFTLFEAYMAYADYNDIMRLTENLYDYVFKTVLGTTCVDYEGVTIDFKAPWPRKRMVDLVKEQTGIETEFKSEAEIVVQIQENKIVLEDVNIEASTKGELIMYLFEAECEKKIISPTFVIDYPRESSPLCKMHRENNEFIERFEAFAANGVELGNAYSELNDPIMQRELLNDQANKLRAGLETASPMDEEFARAIEIGMPPTGGVGLGIDRLIMFITNSHSISDVIPFPIMKR